MTNNSNGPIFKAGYVSILGPPNAGKSTLLNRLLGQKISITSKKPQTTRNRILGVLHRPHAQIVFLDTPGVHRSKKPLNVRIVEAALSTIADADLVLIVADASAPDPDSEWFVVERLKAIRKPVLLVLNKVDLVEKPKLLRMIGEWTEKYDFEAVIPISATHGTQVEALVTAMEKALPPGPPFFPEESLTDMPMRFLAAELIREKAFRLTGQEIPYAIAVTVDSFKEDKGGKLVRIHATIHVERDSQKGIVIGKKGAKLKQIGEAARKEIEDMVEAKVYLKLFVRVQKEWSKDTKALRRFGY